MKQQEGDSAKLEEDGGRKKKPYSTPRLSVHGDVEQITSKIRMSCSRGIEGTNIPSDRNAKENFAPVDSLEVLVRLAALPIETWNYKAEDPVVRHMGPMAQDFYGAFGLGEDEKRIHTIDAAGVALASIQALYRIALDKEAELESLRKRVGELRTELSELKHQLAPL